MNSTVPSVLRVIALITLIDFTTRTFGLRRTLQWVQRSAARPRSAASPDVAVCAELVATAAAFYPRRALCLEQSLALYLLLRRRNVSAELRLGVQPRPFYAHAWVEVNGTPVNESRDLGRSFIAFTALEA